MLKKVLFVFAAFVLLLVIVGMVLSEDYRVTRKITIAAPQEKIHELVGDLKRWPEWTPWEKEDPTMVKTLGEKTTGVGAHQSWKGKDGGGELTFTECDPATGIKYDMAFIDGDKRMPARSWMTYAPGAGGVEVTWGMEGKMDMPVIGGYFALCFDRMAGPMFESGLQELKKKAEAK
jgi:uncharacterized protein YndB with AHSA1/START domain